MIISRTFLQQKETELYISIECCLMCIILYCVDILTHLPLDKMSTILADDMFKWIFLNKDGRIPIQISLKFVSGRFIDMGDGFLNLRQTRMKVKIDWFSQFHQYSQQLHLLDKILRAKCEAWHVRDLRVYNSVVVVISIPACHR